MIKRTALITLLLTAAVLLGACTATAEKTNVNIAVLKGPTGMGAAWLMAENDAERTENAYVFSVAGAPDALVSRLVTGELDMAALPTSAIALLYAKTGGAVQALAVNTLGVLYILERGDTVHTVDDLNGKTVVGAGRGSTTEAVVRTLLGGAAVDYVSEHAEAVALAAAGKYDLVLLPEPFVTSLLRQDDSFRVAVDLTTAWEDGGRGLLPMGGIAVRKAFADEHPGAVAAFLNEYAKSVAFANDNPAEAARLIEQYDILQAAVAESAIPRTNMVCMAGDEMAAALKAFYAALFENDPSLIGGALPGNDFYYVP